MSDSTNQPEASEGVPGEQHPAEQDRTGDTADAKSAPAAQPREGGRDTSA